MDKESIGHRRPSERGGVNDTSIDTNGNSLHLLAALSFYVTAFALYLCFRIFRRPIEFVAHSRPPPTRWPGEYGRGRWPAFCDRPPSAHWAPDCPAGSLLWTWTQKSNRWSPSDRLSGRQRRKSKYLLAAASLAGTGRLLL